MYETTLKIWGVKSKNTQIYEFIFYKAFLMSNLRRLDSYIHI